MKIGSRFRLHWMITFTTVFDGKFEATPAKNRFILYPVEPWFIEKVRFIKIIGKGNSVDHSLAIRDMRVYGSIESRPGQDSLYTGFNKDLGLDNEACQAINVSVNGTPTQDTAILSDGFLWLPLRAVAEKLGLTVSWIQDDQSVVARNDRYDLQFKIGEHFAQAGPFEYGLDQPPMICRDPHWARFTAER